MPRACILSAQFPPGPDFAAVLHGLDTTSPGRDRKWCRGFEGASSEDYDKWLQTHQLQNLVGQAGAWERDGKLHLGRFIFPKPRQYSQARHEALDGEVAAISIQTPYWFKFDKTLRYTADDGQNVRAHIDFCTPKEAAVLAVQE